MTTTKTTLALAVAAIAITGVMNDGCGPPVDHTATLTRLRDAISAPITTPTQMEDHNQLVENVVEGNALDGLRQFEVQERIGRGDQCGTRQLCREQGFRPTDWVYDVGRHASDPRLPAGPTLIVGFDSTGFVERTYYVTRR